LTTKHCCTCVAPWLQSVIVQKYKHWLVQKQLIDIFRIEQFDMMDITIVITTDGYSRNITLKIDDSTKYGNQKLRGIHNMQQFQVTNYSY
jgi:disulfide oxidoreductase YuzD